MAWTAPKTFTDNTPLAAADLNRYLRDNLNETMVAQATTPGSMFFTSDVNKLAERTPAIARVATKESTTSTAYTDLVTYGPEVTVETGSQALVIVGAENSGTVVDIRSFASWQVSGATTIPANDLSSFSQGGAGTYWEWQGIMPYYCQALSPGLNTFTAKYRVDGGAGLFASRVLIVVPF